MHGKIKTVYSTNTLYFYKEGGRCAQIRSKENIGEKITGRSVTKTESKHCWKLHIIDQKSLGVKTPE